MKKILLLVTVVCSVLLFGSVCYAEKSLGNAINSEIVTYINHVPIESYNFKGRTLIAVEDLTHFGFDVYWNEYKRTIKLSRDKTKNRIDIPIVIYPKPKEIGKKAFTVTTTDVSVFVDSYQIESFGGIDGYTLIDVEELKCFNNVSVDWVSEVKAVKVWIEDGLEMYSRMLRPVPNFTYYEYNGAPRYWYYWNWYAEPTHFILTVYMETKDGSFVLADYNTLTITDVLDADGKSILKSSKTERGTSVWPYIFGWTDACLSSFITIKADDLYPKTASEDGGIIKFRYNGSYSDSIRVDQLPYYNN